MKNRYLVSKKYSYIKYLFEVENYKLRMVITFIIIHVMTEPLASSKQSTHTYKNVQSCAFLQPVSSNMVPVSTL